MACVLMSVLVIGLVPSSALAYDEVHKSFPGSYTYSTDCAYCHDPGTSSLVATQSIHGGYTTGTSRCKACHDVHAAPAGGTMLLPGATIQGTCFSCHDGTGGYGVYGAIAARGAAVGAQHRCETTNVVPGGNPNGDSATMTFGGVGGTLSCDDCHSPHAASVVATFTQERRRYKDATITAGRYTSNLLKQRPGGVTTPVAQYGSDWCGACHKGRLSGSGMPNNHPVESTLTAGANAFTYQRAAILATDAATSTTVYGPIGQSNRGYLMPAPRTAQQDGHNPICQQCHEDSRDVGSLTAGGNVGDAATFTQTSAGTDGATVTPSPLTFDNPRFQNFPHETQNTRFLVETGDNLCLNCHPPLVLP